MLKNITPIEPYAFKYNVVKIKKIYKKHRCSIYTIGYGDWHHNIKFHFCVLLYLVFFFISMSIINWRYLQRKNAMNNVEILSLRAPWQNARTKN